MRGIGALGHHRVPLITGALLGLMAIMLVGVLTC
jgi:hypothetical protein